VWMQRRRNERPGTLEAGHTLLEVVVVVLIMGLLAMTMMPALAGYQKNNSVRVAAEQALYQFRQAEMMALTEGQIIQVLFEPSDAYAGAGWTGPGWEICAGICGNAGVPVLYKTVLSPTLNVTADCYRQRFFPQGFVNWCSSLPAVIKIVCIDNQASPTPMAIEVKLVLATGEMSAVKASGSCNSV